MKIKPIPSLVGASLFLVTAWAKANVYAALGLALAIHLGGYFALNYDFFTKPVKSSDGKTTTLIIDLKPATSNKSDITSQYSSLPQTTNPLTSGPYSLTIPTGSGNTSGSPKTISGATSGEFLANIAVCPSNVCVFGGNVASFFRLDRQKDIISASSYVATTTNASSGTVAGQPYMQFVYQPPGSAATYTYVPALGPISCAAGYTFNSSNSRCDLSNPAEAKKGAADGACVISAGTPDPFDPDCAWLRTDRKITQSVDAEGQPMTVVSDNLGTGEVTAVRSTPQGETAVSRTFPAANGVVQREDTVVSAAGTVGTTNTANYEVPNPPVYPGDPGGTVIPTSTGTGTTQASCGALGQPPCATRIVGADGHDVPGITAGDPVGGLGTSSVSSDTQSKLDAVKAKASLPVSSQCPADIVKITIPFPEPIGEFVASDNGFICHAGDTFGPTIRFISIACGWIGALFIVLRA